MQVKLKSLSKNEDFKFILNGKKISNIHESINVVKILSAAYHSSLNRGFTVKLNNFKKNYTFKWA